MVALHPPNHPFTMTDFQPTLQRPLPNATPVLVLGILSILLCICYGILGIILAIIALVLAAKDSQLYAADPQAYTPSSYGNLKAGRICAIIGLILSLLFVAYLLFVISLIGIENLSDPERIMQRLQELQSK
jgi:hypothetical protein